MRGCCGCLCRSRGGNLAGRGTLGHRGADFGRDLRRADRALGTDTGPEIAEEFALGLHHDRAVARLQGALIGGHRPREGKELRVLSECLGIDRVALRIRLASDDFRLASGVRGQFHHGPVSRCTHPLGRLAAPGDLVRGLALTFGPHPGIGGGQVLFRQVGAGQAHVDDLDAQRLCLAPRRVADLAHQVGPVLRQHSGRGDRAQHPADRVGHDPGQALLGEIDAALAGRAAEGHGVGDLPAGKRVHDQPAVVQRRDLHRFGRQPQDPGVISHHPIDQRQLDAQPGFLADRDDLAKAQHQRLFADIDDIDRCHDQHAEDDHHRQGKEGKRAAHQLPPI